MPSKYQPGTLLAGRFRLERLLGEGAFGEVWRAVQFPVERPVAVKLLKLSGDLLMQKRFDYEARALATINHPNCVTLFDFGHAEGTSYLVTELVDGQTLRDWLSGGRRGFAEIVDVARQIGGALAAAHAQQVIHRDLKPENVMICDDPQRAWVVKVLDFGLSKILDDERRDVTKTGQIFGTPGYMSPEMLRGAAQIGGATDQYSFGVVLYEMLEGRPPFVANTGHEVCMMHLLAPVPELNPNVPEDLRALVHVLLRKDPAERFRTTDQMCAALAALGTPQAAAMLPQQRAVPPRPADRLPRVARTELPPPASEPAKSPRRGKTVAILVGLVVVALIAAVGLVVSSRNEPEPKPPAKRRVSQTTATTALAAPDAAGPTPDAAGARPEVERVGSAGCGRSQTAGTHTLRGLEGLDATEVMVHIPKDYDPQHPYPVLVVLHESWQGPTKMLRDTRFADGADEHGFVIVAPQDAKQHSWSTRQSWADAWGDVELAKDELCIDGNHVFLFGFGAGGWAAENIACQFEGVRAIATHAHRLTIKETLCKAPRAVPYLFMAPTKDGWDPVDGGSGCPTGAPKRPLRVQEEALIEQRSCSNKHIEVVRHGGSECYSHEGCSADLRICHIEAGRFWPGLPRTIAIEHCDRGATPDFPYDAVLWDFIEAQRDVR